MLTKGYWKSLIRRLLGRPAPDFAVIRSAWPGMTTVQERDYCYHFARDHYQGKGAIVDLGCWLGATTASLAEGLRESRRVRPSGQIHAYDQFLWEGYMEGYLPDHFQPGESTLGDVEDRLYAWKEWITLQPGDLNHQSWDGEPIEFLLVDVIKSASLAETVVRSFFPALQPGSLVVQQDFSHFYTGWIQLLHYHLRDYFTPIADIPESCSLVFRLEKPIPEEKLRNFDWLHTPQQDEIESAFALARQWVAEEKFARLIAAEICLLMRLRQFEKAHAMIDHFQKTSFAEDIDFQRSLSLLKKWDISHGVEGIQKVGPREYVGGLWEAMGQLQFNFLVEQGLKPSHRFLDIGCGCLRGGRLFIDYLDAGNYFGMDKEPLLLQAGRDELGDELLTQKAPLLQQSDQFEFRCFESPVDVALAQSLFTHLPESQILLCLSRLRDVITSDGVLFATFFEECRLLNNPEEAHDHHYFGYTKKQMEEFGSKTGWRAEYIGHWKHPRGQKMMKYHPI